jgi:hypothetical protein
MGFPLTPRTAGRGCGYARKVARDAVMAGGAASACLARRSRRLMLCEGQLVPKSRNGNRRLPPSEISGLYVFAFIAPGVTWQGAKPHLPFVVAP